MTHLELAQNSKHKPPPHPTPKEEKKSIPAFMWSLLGFFRSYLKDKFREVYIPHTRKEAMHPCLVRGKRSLMDLVYFA